jgi:hypothetical protein
MKNAQNRIDQSVNLLTEPMNIKKSKEIASTVQVEELKSLLVKRLSAEYTDLGEHMIYQAVNEADALASLTPVPLLVLPTLAEEKVRKGAAWAAYQRAVRHSDSFAFAA